MDNSPIDRADTGHILLITHIIAQQPVPDLPSKHGGVVLLVLTDGLYHTRGRHLRLRAADHTRLDGARLIVSEMTRKLKELKKHLNIIIYFI